MVGHRTCDLCIYTWLFFNTVRGENLSDTVYTTLKQQQLIEIHIVSTICSQYTLSMVDLVTPALVVLLRAILLPISINTGSVLGPDSCLCITVPHTPTQQWLMPSVPAVPNCCCPKGSAPYWSNPTFLIFDIRALWHSALSTRASKCQKLKIVG